MLTLKDAARAIDVPYNTVWYHYKHGRIPTQQVGRYQLIDPAVLKAVLSALKYQPRR